ncbi:helix-turn-helix domain-containing protein [Streptomyces venezuelae]|uniref:AraC family transcriptional regulator n=1 Tax=Streptomyces venezuelae TaxID=54571 RepID=A0A5P2BRF0_STRVZ|nr:AraC family transcriptional regulator [Streptomyces venezuelae]QES32298.1 AraC family transcriptional regulator [Streptomyces venezuelae]
MPSSQQVTAWRPRVPGVVEVFHAHFTEHAYPMHVHDVWTLLIVDDGAVRYDLNRRERGTPGDTVSLLPPQVPHNGSPATAHGFRKRVVYLDAPVLDASLIGPAVDDPDITDPLLRRRIGQLHGALGRPGDELEAESRLALVGERLRGHLRPRARLPVPEPGRGVAHNLRELLDARVLDGVTLGEAAEEVRAHPTHLVRAFSAAFGIAPHQYLMARRVERARRLLLDGRPPAAVATEVGFYDQAHLNRHFKRVVGVPPGRYASATTKRAPSGSLRTVSVDPGPP